MSVLIRVIAGRRICKYLNQWWFNTLTHIPVTITEEIICCRSTSLVARTTRDDKKIIINCNGLWHVLLIVFERKQSMTTLPRYQHIVATDKKNKPPALVYRQVWSVCTSWVLVPIFIQIFAFFSGSFYCTFLSPQSSRSFSYRLYLIGKDPDGMDSGRWILLRGGARSPRVLDSSTSIQPNDNRI